MPLWCTLKLELWHGGWANVGIGDAFGDEGHPRLTLHDLRPPQGERPRRCSLRHRARCNLCEEVKTVIVFHILVVLANITVGLCDNQEPPGFFRLALLITPML